MTDPISSLPPDLLLILFTLANFRVIQFAKRFHTEPETVYAVLSVAFGVVYVAFTIDYSKYWPTIIIEAVSKVGLMALATSGVWHRYKQYRDLMKSGEIPLQAQQEPMPPL